MSRLLDPLTCLAIHHGTDKYGAHFYTPVYHELFEKRRHDSLRILEIGVGGYGWEKAGGCSLRMWLDYFPNEKTKIVGIDTTAKYLDLGPRGFTRQGSQTDIDFLRKVDLEFGPFDIVIDDGSHRPDDMLQTFYALAPYLTSQAVYVIEDTQTAFWPAFGGSNQPPLEASKEPPKRSTEGPLFLMQMLMTELHHQEIPIEWPEWKPSPLAKRIKSVEARHNLLIVKFGDNKEPSNRRYTLDDTHIARAYLDITSELQRNPSADGFAHLAMVSLNAGEIAMATEIVFSALGKCPHNPNLLAAAYEIVGVDELRRRLDQMFPIPAPTPEPQKTIEVASSGPPELELQRWGGS